MDVLALKDDDVPDDPLVTLFGDCISAYYHTPEDEEFYCDPPAEWLIARRQAGLDVDVVRKRKKQLPGRRATGKALINYYATKFIKECRLDRYDPLPQFSRKAETRLVLELHRYVWIN